MTEIERVVCGMVNCYLLMGEHGAVLVDTGETADRERIVAACRKKQVRLILLTHGHIDHIQNAAYLAREWNVPIAMNEKDAGLVRNQFAQPLTGKGIFGWGLEKASKRKMQKNQVEDFAADLFLKEGDTLEQFGVQASVLELPGHTEGSIGLDVDGHTVLVGDALMHMLFPGIACIYRDEKKLRESAEKITALGSRTVCFGHGTSMANRHWL